MRVTLILPPLEYFIGRLSGKTGVERNGSEFLSADTAFSQRQYFRMINLPLAVQNGCEWTGGGWGRGLKSVVYWEEYGVSTVGDMNSGFGSATDHLYTLLHPKPDIVPSSRPLSSSTESLWLYIWEMHNLEILYLRMDMLQIQLYFLKLHIIKGWKAERRWLTYNMTSSVLTSRPYFWTTVTPDHFASC